MIRVKHETLDGKEFIKARATGEFDLEASKEALRTLLAHPRFSKSCDILIDFRDAECDLSMADIYEIVQFLALHRQALFGRLAVLVSGDSDFDMAGFLELCAENRGLQVKAFLDLSEAEKWLGIEE